MIKTGGELVGDIDADIIKWQQYVNLISEKASILPPRVVVAHGDTRDEEFSYACFCCKDNVIYLSLFLLSLLTEREAQSVVCHEIGHATRRHSLFNGFKNRRFLDGIFSAVSGLFALSLGAAIVYGVDFVRLIILSVIIFVLFTILFYFVGRFDFVAYLKEEIRADAFAMQHSYSMNDAYDTLVKVHCGFSLSRFLNCKRGAHLTLMTKCQDKFE